MVLSLIIKAVDIILRYPVQGLLLFAKWFYLTLIPFILQYIAIPMFALGILLALAFAGGTVLFIVVFCVFMFYFIRGALFSSKPTIK